jgi:hypothetical protein
VPRKKLGELLIARGIIDEDQLSSALAYQRQWGHRLGAALLAKGFVTEAQLCKAIGEELSIPLVDLAEIQPDPEAVRILDGRFCESHEIFPYEVDEARGRRRLTCAMADPLNIAAVDEIEFTTGCKVRAVLAPLSQIHSAIRRYYLGAQTVIRRVPTRPDIRPSKADGEMVLVRPGGGEETVDTRTQRTDPGTHPPLVEEEDVILLTDEVTRRTDLAELVREREARERQQRQSGGEVRDDLDFLFGVNTQDNERLDKLERMFWGLVRVMAKKGYITKEEFLAALGEK